ncbi:uncharacterized protein RSE6_11948 [Rhynchosporium secalis]|uniref:GmrSD restriction endonucleases N-terminal domain-containing protein n=1 Tax=Rhynchosporium secalis TaxID=38038 RepID=A0A1E1MP52_RHYSE|nr:uncharacterized protein RSE6_11948 [Rhynchosporium secalis]
MATMPESSEVPDSDDTKMTSIEPEVKDDPDDLIITHTNNLRRRPRPERVKPEPAEYVKIDLTLLDNEDDMFGDVDAEIDENGDEIVDLTYEGIAHLNGVRHFVCEGFKIRQIPEPFIVKRSLHDIFRCIESKSIILDPDYQRELVWDEGRAALLVTSILMGYFIPPIIFNVQRSVHQLSGREEERFTRTCVDGKQRLTSIYKFMSGTIGFFDTNVPSKKWYFCHPKVDGRIQISNRNILPNAVKTHFENQFFCCYEYEELTPDSEETMFQLVQRGIALTPAEKMRAMSTEWATFTRQYEDDYQLIVNLSKQNRASGFRLILTIFTMIQDTHSPSRRQKYIDNNTAPPLTASPQALLRILDSKTVISSSMKSKFRDVFTRYEKLIKLSSTQITTTRWKINSNSVFDPSPEFLKRQGGVGNVRTFSPVELVVTAILVAVHLDRTDEELLEDVKAMRIFLRRKHKDLRVNSLCWGTGWGFITREMDIRRKSSDRVRHSMERRLPGRGHSRMRDYNAGDTDEEERGSSSLSEPPSSDTEDEAVPVPAVKKKKLPKKFKFITKPKINGNQMTSSSLALNSKTKEKSKSKKRKPLPGKGKISKSTSSSTSSKKRSRPAERPQPKKKAKRVEVEVRFDGLKR